MFRFLRYKSSLLTKIGSSSVGLVEKYLGLMMEGATYFNWGSVQRKGLVLADGGARDKLENVGLIEDRLRMEVRK